MVHSSHACNIHGIPKDKVELFVKLVVPKFKVGQVVKTEGGKNDSYRIWRYYLCQGRIRYRDGWSVATGCASGKSEEDLELATGDDLDCWGIEYNDNLVKEKQPSVYNAVMRPIHQLEEAVSSVVIDDCA